MPTLTDQQANDVKVMMANVEAAYQESLKARAALSVLLTVGKATCRDVVQYNLATKAIWAYQASVCGIINASGGSAPVVPPPYYLGWRGVSGDAAVDIDCSSAQMRGLGAAPTSYVDPNAMTWRPGATASDTATVQQAVAAAQRALAARPNAGLGIAPVPVTAIIYVVIFGLAVAVAGYIVLKIVEVFGDVPQKREQTRQIAVQATEHRRTLEQRAKCYQDCTTRGRDPIECAKACDRLTPDFKPVIPPGALGFVGKIAGVAVLGLVVYAGWRFVASGGMDRRARGSGGQRALPSSRDQIIDAESEERAA